MPRKSHAQPAKRLAFVNATAVLADQLLQQATIIVEDGYILSIGTSSPPADAQLIDGRKGFFCPGFVDLHTHGADNADYMDGTADAVRTVNRAHARHGTTTIFPTTTTGQPHHILAMLEACVQVQLDWSTADGARIAGVHLYGPFFAADKVGAHPPDGRRDPNQKEWESYFDTGIVRIATCAAELPNAAAFYKAARRRRCLVTVGHSNASWTEMAAAMKLGARHVDHFWCAMSSVPSIRTRLGSPMQGSMAEFVLFHKEMSTEVIADGEHLAPELLEFALRMLGPDRLCLVTDANRAMDMPPGNYTLGPQHSGRQFESNGRVGLTAPNALASSVVGMDHMVRHMLNSTSATIPEAVRMASLTPAVRAGIDHEIGSLEPGKRADILVMDRRFNIRQVYLGGAPLPDRFTG